MTSLKKPVPLAHNTFEPAQGIKKNTPIIFIHGIFGCKEHWENIPQIAADATQRRAYAVDLRNHGDSEWNEEFNLELNVVDLLNFMDEIKAEKAILVGHSMGGGTTLKAVLQTPSRFEKIVVEDRPVKNAKREDLSLLNLYVLSSEKVLKNIPPRTPIDRVRELMDEGVIKEFPPAAILLSRRKRLDRKIILKQMPDGTYGFKGNTQVLRETMMRGSIDLEPSGVFEGPACFIYGEQSPSHVNQDNSIKIYFPKAQLIGIKDAGHLVHTERPEEFTEALLEFLKE